MQEIVRCDDVIGTVPLGFSRIFPSSGIGPSLQALLGNFSLIEITAGLLSDGYAKVTLVRDFKGLWMITDEISGCRQTVHQLRRWNPSDHFVDLTIEAVGLDKIALKFSQAPPLTT